MEYSAHVFVFVLLAGLAWLLAFDLLFGEPIHTTGGIMPLPLQDPHCGTHEPHTRTAHCDKGIHDHNMDGQHDYHPNTGHFHEQDAGHHHQTGNLASPHPANFDHRSPHHTNQIDHRELMRYN